jgi:DNA modification methylase
LASSTRIGAEGGIIAGHGRVEAAKLLHLSMVPTVCVDHLTPAQLRAYVIADNKLAENAGWDRELLRLELGELSVNLDFDVTLTGFDTAEIDFVLSDAPPDEADRIPEITSKRAVTRPGDLWHIGKHVLLCGDARNQQSYTRLLGGHLAEMVCTDPPFNVAIDGHVCGLGKVKHREFQMAVGEMSGTEFTAFLHSVFKNCVANSTNGSLHFVFMDWRHITEVTNAAASTYAELKSLCVWAKTNAGMGSLYRSQHELVFVFKNGTAPHINNVELGKHRRNRTNLWNYAGINSFGKDRDAQLAMHPTPKPVALVADAILDASRRNGIVLDAFSGSGTTLIGAERTGRRGYGIEIDPLYADAVIQRFEATYGIEAVLAESGDRFDDVSRRRAAEMETSDDE